MIAEIARAVLEEPRYLWVALGYPLMVFVRVFVLGYTPNFPIWWELTVVWGTIMFYGLVEKTIVVAKKRRRSGEKALNPY